MEYVMMSNGLVEHVSGTTRRSITENILNKERSWTQNIDQILFRYCCRVKENFSSPIKLMYNVRNKISDEKPRALTATPPRIYIQDLELLARQSV